MWSETGNIAELLEYVKALGVQGVEITLARKEDVMRFELNDSQMDILKSLPYKSIHAPFRMVSHSFDDEELRMQLDKIGHVYDKIGAKTVVVHPNELPSSDILDDYNFHISLENLSDISEVSLMDMKRLLEKHSKMKLCLDVTHSFTWSKHETIKYIDEFKGNISQIHLSGGKNGVTHLPLRECDDEFISSIMPIKKLDVPFVVEEDLNHCNLEFIREEIGYIRKIFEINK